MDNTTIMMLTPLIIGWMLDIAFGDPTILPHPIVFFGKTIAKGEHILNHGQHRKAKGALLACSLIALTFIVGVSIFHILATYPIAYVIFGSIIVFYCLAGTTLIREVKDVFTALDNSLENGRRQVARIVGRDTSELSEQEVRKAALETLAENLSDGVVAPLFWFALLGFPGMITYKMVNTLDSMIGYRTERYREFGCTAAHIDDIANYIPARLTVLLMLVADFLFCLDVKRLAMHLKFVRDNAHNHSSPNSGWPESALASILDCQFGGGHYYFGEYFPKPFIGTNDRKLRTADVGIAIRINRTTEVLTITIIATLIITMT